ncbi:UDP-glucose dehydrogenase family protein [Agrococcus sp. SGAir0287]|uniref:UDP-glucose dehydrogenase family protein n=1 Tax=Agrococcus sp. SGAir0287 TaxID=2070347 RepID=UPI0010CD150A|nr:UDP-glucose/GDP-mannose dehydrogenase family protein [Agrococcus sp. SGAir0287]QCR18655.1 UDP-glucose 6-dehydrogenase [Agrococcus sp. SGAir0287]
MTAPRIAVVGCGYLGAVHAAGMASLGLATVGIDVDASKVAALGAGRAPFYEPGLEAMLQQGIDAGSLRFATDAEGVEADVWFVCVGTPQRPGSNDADMTHVDAAVSSLLPHLREGMLVVGKSTVPVGTAERLAALVEATGARLAWNPEFLREGLAVTDTLAPDRLVYGVRSGDDAAVATLDAVYASILERGTPRIVTDFATAELVKVSANAFLATKISFINAMAEVAEASGADVVQLADAIGIDARIGRRFLNSGIGFGGGCLPKDIRAFRARSIEVGAADALGFLDEVDRVNLRRRDRMVALVERELDAAGGGAVAMLGLAFKPDSDDVRDSPALDVAMRLAERHDVVAYDPEAAAPAARRAPALRIAGTLDEALADAAVLALGTEWRVFRELDPTAVAERTAARVVVDGRNVLDRDAWAAAGFRVVAIGRPDRDPTPTTSHEEAIA